MFRNLVDRGDDGNYNLMLLCWPKGIKSTIHDHSGSHCLMKILQGSLKEVRYSWPSTNDDVMEEKGTKIAKENEVLYMSDQLGLHQVRKLNE